MPGSGLAARRSRAGQLISIGLGAATSAKKGNMAQRCIELKERQGGTPYRRSVGRLVPLLALSLVRDLSPSVRSTVRSRVQYTN